MTHPQGTRQEGRQEARLEVWRCPECGRLFKDTYATVSHDAGEFGSGKTCQGKVERIEVAPASQWEALNETWARESRARLEAEQSVTHLREALEGLRESCREEVGPTLKRCGKPAEFVLWGKLLGAEALGPRCYDHAAEHVGHQGLAPNAGYAILDLRPVLRSLTNLQPEHPEGGSE